MTLAVAEQTRPPETIPDLWLAFAPVKRAPVEWLVEKATELGVARLVPVVTGRTVVERLRLDRLQSIAIEAAEQCGRTVLPELAEPVALEAFLKDNERTLYFADETGGEPAAWRLRSRPRDHPDRPRRRLHARRNAPRSALLRDAKAISLGPRILRAETAALAAVTT